MTSPVTPAVYADPVAKILMFQINGERRIAANPPVEVLAGSEFSFTSLPRDVAANLDLGVIALMFPEAWRPFIVLPGTGFPQR